MTLEDSVHAFRLHALQRAQELGNVPAACRELGISRDAFYRVKRAYEEEGIDGLQEKTQRKPNLANRVPPEIEEAVLALSMEHPTYGLQRISDKLRRRDVWNQHGRRPRHLAAPRDGEHEEASGPPEEGGPGGAAGPLSEEQIEALEKLRQRDVGEAETETHHPGFLLSQDTFYAGFMKGVGRIYLQAVIDTYSKAGFGKLYTSKLPVTAADVLNDPVFPFFEEQGVPVLRIMTDRGTEYCGSVGAHAYELFLALNDIEHTRTKVKSPQTNGICERFHRTVLDEFLREAFRKKLYTDVESLQKDLDTFLVKYNTDRPNRGKHCGGRTPMQAFQDGKKLVEEKALTAAN